MSSRAVRGRLVFRQAGPSVPIHHLAVEGRVHHPLELGGWCRAVTDLDGRFVLTLPPGAALELRVLDLDHRYAEDGSPEPREHVAYGWSALTDHAPRISALLDTLMSARDNATFDAQADRVLRLPVQGYGTTEFDMSPARVSALYEGAA